MYAIYADGNCIYSDTFALEATRVTGPKLALEDNTAGTLTVTLPPGNAGYDSVKRLTTDITVEKDGKWLWSGRVLSERKDLWNNRALTCEGELAFFNDTTQPPCRYEGLTVRGYLEKLLEVHNAKAAENRRFVLGVVSVYDNNFPVRCTNYEPTMAYFSSLVEEFGGHLRVRHEDGIRYLDYLQEWPDTTTQLIEFGSNLLDFTKNWDASDFATAVLPLGARLDKSPITELDAWLTVEEANGGSVWVESPEAIEEFGRIEKTVRFDDVDDPEQLLEKGKKYLSELQFDNMELELSALDLHYLDRAVEEIRLLDEVRVISRPHGLDRLFPVKKLDIPLDSPENTKFTLGDTVKTSLTAASHSASTGLRDKVDKLPKAHAILEEAKKNATAILNLATTGFITITRDEYGANTLYISNTRDYTKADKLWKWNVNGLGYSKDGGKTFGLAMTMDGAIVADFITAGVMNADVIRIGVLKDYGENTVFDLNEGTLTMKKGSICLGQYFDEDGRANYNFTLDNDGNLYARRGTFAGTLSAAKGTFGGRLTAATGDFKGIVQAEDFLNAKGESMIDKISGKLKGDYLDLMGINVVNEKGDVVLAIDQKGLRFPKQYSPIQYQFAATAAPSGSDLWHGEMTETDKYRRDSLDGGETWGEPYQFRGEDGKPGTDGNDASVTFGNIRNALKRAASTQTSFITVDEAGFTKIYGGKIYGAEIYAGGIGEEGGQVIGLTDGGITIFDGIGSNVLTIKSDADEGGSGVSLSTGFNYLTFNTPYVNFEGFSKISFSGELMDFTDVSDVVGLHATFA